MICFAHYYGHLIEFNGIFWNVKKSCEVEKTEKQGKNGRCWSQKWLTASEKISIKKKKKKLQQKKIPTPHRKSKFLKMTSYYSKCFARYCTDNVYLTRRAACFLKINVAQMQDTGDNPEQVQLLCVVQTNLFHGLTHPVKVTVVIQKRVL